jgi:serine/threonine protein kinase
VSDGSPTEAFGPYLVYEQLGIGGMAQVHRAVMANAELSRPVALKRMLSHIASNEEMVKSFVREARLASYLRHENVAQTYDLGRVGDIYFIEMELITGRNLREVLRHCGATTGPMPVQLALAILNQICDALDYAHNLCDETGAALGIIHRDVSPSNVIVSDTGVVKLIDFGIAKASGAGMQTMGGTLKGKFGYMAPEYIAGRIDARADLFAVGVIAHELLTNKPLFSGRDDIDTLTRVRDMHIDPPSKKNPLVPPEIDDIVMTALERDPDRRWQHATALRSALTTLTKRLGLVATNAQVVQWLDWAFEQKRKRGKPGQDTEPDPDPMHDEPSISVEQQTVEIGSLSKKSTLMMPDAEPAARAAGERPRLAAASTAPANAEPRAKSPSAAPAYAEAPRPRSPSAAPPYAEAPRPRSPSAAPPYAEAPRPRSPSAAPPLGAPLGSSPLPVQPGPRPHAASSAPAYVEPPRPRSPSSAPAGSAQPTNAPRPVAIPPGAPTILSYADPPRPHSPSSAPLGLYAGGATPTHRTQPASVPPPISASRVGPLPSPPGGMQASQPLPVVPAPVPSSGPLPVLPGLNAAPFSAPRPSALGSSTVPVDPARSAAVQREFAERTAAIPETALSPRSGGASPVLVMVLVIVAAAVAALAVYFVLPLLT